MIEELLARHLYVSFILIAGIGLYILIDSSNLVKKIIALNIFQLAVFLMFITSAYRTGGNPPIIEDGVEVYVNPLPHVLILTAIVVGVSLTALGLSLVVHLHSIYGSIDEDVIEEVMSADE